MTRDEQVAAEIKAGRCPFGMLAEGQAMAHCPLGFPGCGCADESMCNKELCYEIPPLDGGIFGTDDDIPF